MANKVVIAGVNTSNLPKLKNEEIVELMRQVKAGDEFARDKFVVANLRLVLSVVQRFAGQRDKADDMFQVGCVGLLKAIDNFDETLNVRFSTYAVPMIVGEIRRFLRDNNSVRVSRSIRDVAYKCMQVKENFIKDHNTEPTLEQIAETLNIPLSEVIFALDALTETISLSEPVYNDGNDTIKILDQISDDKNCDEDIIEKLSLSEAIKNLGEREKEILLMRYYVGKTQMEVSEEVGISQAQVSRLEKNALNMIKNFIE
ncbi:MAG: RNA polymerase sporulation sigma factor SigG [Clostridiales bacterium]|nr:RNA polymerase sporulation sigma factor SigG [Clostridiales bacterium]